MSTAALVILVVALVAIGALLVVGYVTTLRADRNVVRSVVTKRPNGFSAVCSVCDYQSTRWATPDAAEARLKAHLLEHELGRLPVPDPPSNARFGA